MIGTICTAFFALVATCVSGLVAWQLNRLKTGQDQAAVKVDEAAAKVEEVKTSLSEHRELATNTMSAIADDVATVKKQTNGLVELATKNAGDAGFLAGVKSETDKIANGGKP